MGAALWFLSLKAVKPDAVGSGEAGTFLPFDVNRRRSNVKNGKSEGEPVAQELP